MLRNKSKIISIDIESSVDDLFMELEKFQTPNEIGSKFLVGASFESEQLIAWFSGQPYHVAPLSLNLMHNAIVRSVLNESFSIHVQNKPMPKMKSLSNDNYDSASFGKSLITNISFAIAFVTAFPLLFYIKVRLFSAISINIFSPIFL